MQETRNAARTTRAGRMLGGLAGLIVAVLLGGAVVGCGPPYLNVLIDANGQQIRADDITNILYGDEDGDGIPDLTEEEQRDSLRGLGITDERLIDALIRAV